MNIELPAEQMRDLVTKALFESITPEVRDDILQKAIVYLLSPEKNPYSSKPASSPIEDAMRTAAFTVANTIARERLAADPAFVANIEKLFADVGKRLFEGELREKLLTTISDSVVDGLRGR